ncbi:retrovirus-related pol polyprotein from transposon TNT 1-94 [Tanacetum coccineum]|uniref:Retrovirus-related pol polyprotein from transposon TNT 1-94 n=1 Tax=Tanacetum coccineum TaxID=301880 RepID=A0ABQ5FHP0_9ASTR
MQSLTHQHYSGLAVPMFKQGDDPIDAINKMMSFLSTVGRQNSYAAGTSRTRANTLGTGGNYSGQQRVVKCFNCQGEDPGIVKGPVTQLVITHNAAYQANDLDVYDSDCDKISTAKAVLMANLSSYGSDVLFEVPIFDNTNNDMLNQSVQGMPYSEPSHFVEHPENEIHSDSNIIPYYQYLIESQNATVQDTNSSTQQDALILSVFEQLSNQVTNYNKVNNDNLIANETLSAELERYKERVKLLEERQNVDLGTREKLIIDDIIQEKDAQFADFEKEINNLKQTLSEQSKEKELLTKTFNVFKSESKEKEAKNIDTEIALEKKVKELENIKAQQIRPMLYDGNVIAKETNVISIADSEETLMLEEESRSKMLLKQSDPMVLEKKVNTKPINYAELNRLSKDFGKRFVPQRELSDEQALHPITDQSASSPVKIEAPRELPKVSLVNTSLKKLKYHLGQFDNVVKKRITPNALTEGEWGFEHTKAVFQNEIIPFLKTLKDIFNVFDKDLLNEHTMEQAAILREVVEQAKSRNPLDSASYSSCMYVKLIQELLGYVRDTYPDIHKPRVNPSTSASGSKPSGNKKNDRISQTPSSNEKNKVEVQSRKVKSSLNKRNSDSKNVCNEHVKHPVKGVKNGNLLEKCLTLLDINGNPTGRTFTLVGNACPLTRITATNKVPLRVPIPLEVVAPKSVQNSKPKVVQIVLWYLDSGCSKHMTEDRSQLTNFVHKFLGTVKFGNDQVAKIMGYDLEVAFRKHTCFVRNLEGVDLLLGSRGTNLYSLSIGDMMASSPICLLSKATKIKSWLWHRRLSYLNFGAINHLARHGLVRSLPRLKFKKEHLCSACAIGKSKKQSHKPKSEDTNQEKLYLLHMDLCGPMRVASVNGKKYILVIVDDYSRFTWVKFLATKYEALDFIIKFLKMIQVRLNATVRNIRIDNGTEFVNQTLRDYYEQVGISHETSVMFY